MAIHSMTMLVNWSIASWNRFILFGQPRTPLLVIDPLLFLSPCWLRCGLTDCDGLLSFLHPKRPEKGAFSAFGILKLLISNWSSTVDIEMLKAQRIPPSYSVYRHGVTHFHVFRVSLSSSVFSSSLIQLWWLDMDRSVETELEKAVCAGGLC